MPTFTAAVESFTIRVCTRTTPERSRSIATSCKLTPGWDELATAARHRPLEEGTGAADPPAAADGVETALEGRVGVGCAAGGAGAGASGAGTGVAADGAAVTAGGADCVWDGGGASVARGVVRSVVVLS